MTPDPTDIAHELDTLDGMFDLLTPGEAKIFRDQLDRVRASIYDNFNQLRTNHEALKHIVSEAVQDVGMEVLALEHDLESTRRERDELLGT